MLFDANGHTVTVQTVRSTGNPLLDQAALDAVRQWQFAPTLVDGVAVPVAMTTLVNFTLK